MDASTRIIAIGILNSYQERALILVLRHVALNTEQRGNKRKVLSSVTFLSLP